MKVTYDYDVMATDVPSAPLVTNAQAPSAFIAMVPAAPAFATTNPGPASHNTGVAARHPAAAAPQA